MRAKQEKYIDLDQFPKTPNGGIDWKSSEGLTIEFFYNNEKHILELIERTSKDRMTIKLDRNKLLKNVHTSKIKCLTFDKELYVPNYLYQVGEIINNCTVVKQIMIHKNSACQNKGYICRCNKDNYEFSAIEYSLKTGHGCPVCSGTKTVKGINDVATTDPDVVKYFVDINDAYTHTRSSTYRAEVKCLDCGKVKKMLISELTKYGKVFCDLCSDGVSYPNKFIREMLKQVSNQYETFIPEYSPEWAGKYRYDNYVKLLNDTNLLIEMDGGYHYLKETKFYGLCNDQVKNSIALDNNHLIVRVDCNYLKTGDRFEYIKDNVIKTLSPYFDLSYVDWNKCNESGTSNLLISVLNFYKTHPKHGLPDIAREFCISLETMYNYLYVGEQLGICTYIRNDPNRIKNSKPVAMFDKDNNLIGIFKSSRVIEESFPELNLHRRSVSNGAYKNVPYKNFIFKYVTYDEYQAGKLSA